METFSEKCTGCLRCRLGCSEFYTKAFNPFQARIQIASSETGCHISFTEDCQGCGICVDQCFYGAIEKTRKEAAQ